MARRTLFIALVAAHATAAWAQPTALNVVSSVKVRTEGGAALEIVGTQKPNFTTFSMADPPRLVIDLSEAVFKGVPSEQKAGGAIVQVKTASYGSDQSAIARVVITFAKETETEVEASDTTLVVRVAGAPALAQADGPKVAVAAPSDEGARVALEERRKQEEAARAAAEEKRRADEEEKARKLAEKKAAEDAARVAAEEKRRADEEERVRKIAEKKAAEEAARAAAEEKRRAEEEQKARKVAERKAAEEAARVAAAEKRRAEEDERARKVAEKKAAEEAARLAAEERRRAEEEGKRAAAEEKRRAAEEARARKLAEKRAAEEAERAAAEEKRRAAEEARARKVAEKRAAEEAERAAAEEKRRATEEARARKVAEKRAAEEAARTATSRRQEPAETHAAATGAGTVEAVGFKQLEDASRIFVRTDSPVRYSIGESHPGVIVLELMDTKIGRKNNRRPFDTSFFEGPIAMVSPTTHGSSVRVEITLKTQAPYSARQEGGEIVVDFRRAGGTGPVGQGDPGVVRVPR